VAGFAALHHDLLELRNIHEPAQGAESQLQGLPGGHRFLADLPGGNLDVLALDGVYHIRRGELVLVQLVRVEPGSHAVVLLAEKSDIAYSR
jgi:hypothetical protein